jgi:hypothetical protein
MNLIQTSSKNWESRLGLSCLFCTNFIISVLPSSYEVLGNALCLILRTSKMLEKYIKWIIYIINQQTHCAKNEENTSSNLL